MGSKALNPTPGSRLKLHDLQPGQRFTFTDKHRGKVFEIAGRSKDGIVFFDVATGEPRTAFSNRKTFRMDVELVTEDKMVTLTQEDAGLLTTILHEAYLEVAEKGGSEELKSGINKLYLKIKG